MRMVILIILVFTDLDPSILLKLSILYFMPIDHRKLSSALII